MADSAADQLGGSESEVESLARVQSRVANGLVAVIEVLDGHLSFAQKSAFRDAVLERFQEALDVAVWGSSES